MSVANVADTKIGRDVVSILLGDGTDVVQCYATAARNVDIRTENLKSVKEFWDYDVAVGGGMTLELELDVRDEDLLTSYFPSFAIPSTGGTWCECLATIVWGNGDTDTGTAVITKSNHSAPGEGKQKFSYTLKMRPSA
jgi:hypothetical protein